LLYLPNVRESLCAADAVLPSLNAGSETLHRQINRPHHDMTFERHMKGLIAFRREYHGNLWVEVMLVAGVNDTEEALWDIAAALDKIDPDEVHLMLPTRPPAERWVRPPDAARLRRAQTILGSTSRLVPAFEEPCAPRNGEDLMGAALGSISRHPMNLRQLEAALSPWTPTQVREALDQLEARGKIQRVWRFDELFWCPAPSSYGETKAASAKT
jgi:wyosine [tRNA(Phe)-imidazoG37] synthetase (radical SAM superfamily)